MTSRNLYGLLNGRTTHGHAVEMAEMKPWIVEVTLLLHKSLNERVTQ